MQAAPMTRLRADIENDFIELSLFSFLSDTGQMDS
jgi:hypothetical protein